MSIGVPGKRDSEREEYVFGCFPRLKERLKQSGMLWSRKGASHLLAVRCALLSGWFEDFWKHYHRAGRGQVEHHRSLRNRRHVRHHHRRQVEFLYHVQHEILLFERHEYPAGALDYQKIVRGRELFARASYFREVHFLPGKPGQKRGRRI